MKFTRLRKILKNYKIYKSSVQSYLSSNKCGGGEILQKIELPVNCRQVQDTAFMSYHLVQNRLFSHATVFESSMLLYLLTHIPENNPNELTDLMRLSWI